MVATEGNSAVVRVDVTKVLVAPVDVKVVVKNEDLVVVVYVEVAET